MTTQHPPTKPYISPSQTRKRKKRPHIAGVFGDVEAADDFDVDHLVGCEHAESERFLCVDSGVEWYYSSPCVALLRTDGG